MLYKSFVQDHLPTLFHTNGEFSMRCVALYSWNQHFSVWGNATTVFVGCPLLSHAVVFNILKV